MIVVSQLSLGFCFESRETAAARLASRARNCARFTASAVPRSPRVHHYQSHQTNLMINLTFQPARGTLISRGFYGARFHFVAAPLNDPVGDLADHFFDQEPKMAPAAEIGGRDVSDAVGVSAKLIAFFKA
jgi:hypothetical protein